MRHSVHALFRVTALAALLLCSPPGGGRSGARPGRSGRPDNADEPGRRHRVPGEEVRGCAQNPQTGAGPGGGGGARQAPDQGAHAHPHRDRRSSSGSSSAILGIKQFKKAIEIQSDIGLTKALVTPELTDAFNEAKGEAAAAPAATPPGAAPPATPPPPAEPEFPANGLVHEPVSEGKQGSAISVTVGVRNELEFEKMILAYRPEGASEFLGREMKEVSDGRYGAEIPTSATSGGTVAYYIEAEDADGAPIAARGSVDNPMVIHLLGVGITHTTKTRTRTRTRTTRRRIAGTSSALMAGSGVGWATGNGDTNADIPIKPAGLAMAGVGQFAPEVGYWLNSSLMLSVQIRYEYITGTTDIYETTHTKCPKEVSRRRTTRSRGSARRPGSTATEVPPVLLAGGGPRHYPARRELSSRRASPNCGPDAQRDLRRHDRRGVGAARSGRRRRCTTSPSARRSWCRRTRCSRSPTSPPTSTATWASRSRSDPAGRLAGRLRHRGHSAVYRMHVAVIALTAQLLVSGKDFVRPSRRA